MSGRVGEREGSIVALSCKVCNKTTDRVKRIVVTRCVGCYEVAYCSRAHQKQDWKEHKQFCKINTAAEEVPASRQVSQAVGIDEWFGDEPYERERHEIERMTQRAKPVLNPKGWLR